jgi:exopolyphosphatase/guanosine-5'-triphosphate,3'-diphosphate pyrophosphatase
VHELGLAIAHSQHQRHGAYILKHADMAGFSRQEQQLLAAIVESHRRKPEKSVITALPVRYRVLARHITAILRLAVLFRRARRAEALPRIRVVATRQRLRISLPADWLDQHPLTEADLEQEREPLAELGLELEIVTE